MSQMRFIVGTVDEAIKNGRRRSFQEGKFRGVADYLFETGPGELLGPQALIARQICGWKLPVHFHMQHQFQVVLRGSGRLGKHILAPGSVHYTSPQSAYGPILAGDEGLDYFTLRLLTDKGAWYMPESRRFMQPNLHKRQVWGINTEVNTKLATLIPLEDNGIGAWMWRTDTGQLIEVDSKNCKSGRFHLVLDGAFKFNNLELPLGSCVYGAPDETCLFTAIEPNSKLIVVQFPEDAMDYWVPPDRRIAPSSKGIPVSCEIKSAFI
jgi:hypothetical protein